MPTTITIDGMPVFIDTSPVDYDWLETEIRSRLGQWYERRPPTGMFYKLIGNRTLILCDRKCCHGEY